VTLSVAWLAKAGRGSRGWSDGSHLQNRTLLYPCYKGRVEFTASYAFTPDAATPGPAGYMVDGFAKCKAGGRPETSWRVGGKVRAHETVNTLSLGLFVLTPNCVSSEGFKVTYLNPEGPSSDAPHESVIVGSVVL
jgi:hypothetical protein